MNIQGQIISGEFDVENNEFSLQRVKNFFTESTLKETQLNNIYEYLKKHEQESDGQIITLYDQMPLQLTQDEIKQLISDLEQVHLFFN
jgi:CRISPR/Cas system CSM-associated protein Csm2 small subunit